MAGCYGMTRMRLRRFFWQSLGGCPVRIRGERFVCHPRHRNAWRRWEPNTLSLLEDRLSAGSIFWDIGSHIGQAALYASRKCAHVVCFEPDPVALSYLTWNIVRNKAGNVTVLGAALATTTGFAKMGAFKDGMDLGSSVTSCRPSPHADTIMAPCLGIAVWTELLRKKPPDFVKMDIEGGEFELLPAMAGWLAQNRPGFLLSLHTAPLRRAGQMRPDEARKALQNVAQCLSFYNQFTEMATAKTYPITELPTRMAGESGDDSIWLEGIFLE